MLAMPEVAAQTWVSCGEEAGRDRGNRGLLQRTVYLVVLGLLGLLGSVT